MLQLIHDGHCIHRLDMKSEMCEKHASSGERTKVTCILANKEWSSLASVMKTTEEGVALKFKLEAFLSIQRATHSDSTTQCVFAVDAASDSVSYKIYDTPLCETVFLEQISTEPQTSMLAQQVLEHFNPDERIKLARTLTNLNFSEIDLSDIRIEQANVKNSQAEKQSFGSLHIKSSSVENLSLLECSANDVEVVKTDLYKINWTKLKSKTLLFQDGHLIEACLERLNCDCFEVINPNWSEYR
ncbi:hypothetical protein JQC92_00120 [Shewanella sp. 202IG2-18]|uniref:hypothetical protein n=1 Tax=Parashewanella hymeniacidonis TaxID=2807618 RepID=UPI0019614C24|nr:hypothetical protein [Parashewanella hymeniacidonis]MBM7070459.1 hypothetical protein [Parashewanella hymeniacidonis]